jgi:hypothetical protein
LGNSFGISPFVFYLVNSLLKPRNKAYTTTLWVMQKNSKTNEIKLSIELITYSI